MLTCYVLVCCDDVDTFCPCLCGVLFLFGVLLINGQCHYLVFYTWPHIGAQAGFGVTYLSGHFGVLLGVL